VSLRELPQEPLTTARVIAASPRYPRSSVARAASARPPDARPISNSGGSRRLEVKRHGGRREDWRSRTRRPTTLVAASILFLRRRFQARRVIWPRNVPIECGCSPAGSLRHCHAHGTCAHVFTSFWFPPVGTFPRRLAVIHGILGVALAR